MLDFIRKHQRLMMGFLFILIVPSFVFFGVSDYSSFVSNEVKIANINKESISQSEFNQTWTERLNAMRQEQGAQFNIGAVDTPANRQLWLDRLISDKVISQEIQEKGYFASDNIVRQALATDPQFSEDGRFSMDKYNNFLQGIGATGQQYENFVRVDQSYQLVVGPSTVAVSLPKKTTELLEEAMTQERSVRLRMFEAANYESGLEVSEAEIQQWYDAHAKELEVPAYVNASYVLLNQEAAVAKVANPSTEDLQGYYNSNIRRYTTLERRHVKHIQLSGDNLEQANDVAAKAKADPNSFDALAKEFSIDAGTKNLGGELGVLARGDIPALDDGVFTLAQAGITDPVKVGNAYHIFNIVSIQPGSVKSYDEVKDEVLKEVKLQLASEQFAEMATKLTNIVNEQRTSLQAVKDDLQLEIKHVAGITPTGLLSVEQVGADAAQGSAVEALFATPRVREVLYSREVFNESFNSGTIEISPSEILVVRVAEKVQAAVPSLDKVREQVLARVKTEKALRLAREEGAKVLTEVQADSSSAGFSNEVMFSRMLGNQAESMMNAIMHAPTDKLPAYVGFELDNGYGIALIESKKEGSADAKQFFNLYQMPQLEVALGNDVGRGVSALLREQHKVEVLAPAQQIIAGDQQR